MAGKIIGQKGKNSSLKIKNIKQKAQTDAAGIIEKRFCIRKMRIYAKILCKTG